MSVTKIDKKEIDLLACHVKAYIYKLKHLMRDMDYYYREKFSNFNEDTYFKNRVVDRLFWYLHVANSVAYGLQYQEPIELDRNDYYENANSIPSMSLKELMEALEHLRSNLFTNDGNMFLGESWNTIFKNIIEALKDLLIERIK